MPVAEIEYPLAGALLGTTFSAGGMYDLTRTFSTPVPAGPVPAATNWVGIRCKFLPQPPNPPPLVNPTSDTFAIPMILNTTTGMLEPVPVGPWDVTFTGVPAAPDWVVVSYLVDDAGNETASEIVIDITVTGDMGGGMVAVGEVP